ncbi:MAG: 2-hydroxyglutaryl-CoA dehydratase [Chloroflexi bacterium]|nr:2-hydroxyglutaryl-CoA dehydratase [Chloroflexota bacterium]
MTKVVIIDESDRVISLVVSHTGAEHRRMANRAMEQALAQAGLKFDQIAYVVATGYGRINVPFADRQLTELTCHARGVASFFPAARTALDIGGQDAKGMKLGPNGKLVDFVMNDRCAAGTGRFLEVLALTLGLKLEDLGDIALRSKNKTSISSTCTIFAQQEIVSLISEGVTIEDIVAGLHDAIAKRSVRMLQSIKVEPEVVFTGGVAWNSGMVRAIEENLGRKVLVPENPLISGALGAAIMGKELVYKARAQGKTLETRERVLAEATFFQRD